MIGSIIIKKNSNFHFLNNGFSAMWLVILYIIGGYLGKYIFSNKKKLTSFYFIFWIINIFIFLIFHFCYFFYFIKKEIKNTLQITYQLSFTNNSIGINILNLYFFQIKY